MASLALPSTRSASCADQVHTLPPGRLTLVSCRSARAVPDEDSIPIRMLLCRSMPARNASAVDGPLGWFGHDPSSGTNRATSALARWAVHANRTVAMVAAYACICASFRSRVIHRPILPCAPRDFAMRSPDVLSRSHLPDAGAPVPGVLPPLARIQMVMVLWLSCSHPLPECSVS